MSSATKALFSGASEEMCIVSIYGNKFNKKTQFT